MNRQIVLQKKICVRGTNITSWKISINVAPRKKEQIFEKIVRLLLELKFSMDLSLPDEGRSENENNFDLNTLEELTYSIDLSSPENRSESEAATRTLKFLSQIFPIFLSLNHSITSPFEN